MQDINLYIIIASAAIQMWFISLDGAIRCEFLSPHFFIFQTLCKYYFCDRKEMLLKVRIEMRKLSPGVLVGKPQYGRSAESISTKAACACCACRPAWLNCEVWGNDFPNHEELIQAKGSRPFSWRENNTASLFSFCPSRIE